MTTIFIISLTAYLIGSINFHSIISWFHTPKKFPNQFERTFFLSIPRIKLLSGFTEYLKGLLGAYLIFKLTNSELMVVFWGTGLVIGNTWSIFNHFREKGNYLGILGILSFINFAFTILCILIWCLLFVFLKHIELSLVISSTILPFLIMGFSWIGIDSTYILWGIFIAIFTPIKLRSRFPTILEGRSDNLMQRFKNRNEK